LNICTSEKIKRILELVDAITDQEKAKYQNMQATRQIRNFKKIKGRKITFKEPLWKYSELFDVSP